MSPASLGENRGHKTTRRSRFGCRNCKLRKLKCDESKPRCKRCSSFGVICNFEPHVSDLQPLADDAFRSLAARRGTRLCPPPTSAVWASDASSCFHLNAKCQEFVNRYLGRSLITPGDPKMRQVNRKLLILAFHHPYLMHASVAVALAYDRHLSPSSTGSRRTLEECYHWSRSTALLNQRLREPIKTKDKDPIWGTAAALAVLSFASLDASTPEASWPLKSSDASDLEWLRMGQGKMSLWDVANPMRPESLFSIMAPTYAHLHAPLPDRAIDDIPKALTAVCGLDDLSTIKNNPYLDAAYAVSRIQDLPDDQVTIGQTERFTQAIRGPFESLLRAKDPVALLLLYLWYRKAGRCMWWIGLRARVECPAICTYLRLYHGEHSAVQAFLPGGTFARGWG